MTALSNCSHGLNNIAASSQDVTGSHLNPMSFTDQHGNVILERLRYQRDTGRFCDVYLVVKERYFTAHRNILAACSPYFDSILRSNKVVKEQVIINCENPTVFELLLNYMYSGSVVIDRSSVTDLLKLANNFLVTKLKNYCAEYLDRYMDVSNCLSVKELARKYNLPALLKSACDYFDVNINRCLLESSDVLEFSITSLKATLRDQKYVNVVSPDVHLKTLIRWTSYNPEQRSSFFKELLSTCPISLVQAMTIEYILDYSPFLNTSQSSRLVLLQALYEHSSLMSKYEAQYRNMLTQYNEGVNMYFNGESHPYGLMQMSVQQNNDENQSSTGQVSCVDGIVQCEALHGGESVFDNEFNNSELHSGIEGQPPVVGASSTDEVLKATIASPEANRPALKLKIQLGSMNIINRKNRLLGKSSTSGRHKMYRKSISSANHVLCKRRGRPPKVKTTFLHVDIPPEEVRHTEEEFYPDCGIDLVDAIVFEENDEVGPCNKNGHSEDENENGTVEKSFACDHCSAVTSTMSSLRKHIARLHMNNVVYVCSLCVFECRWNHDYYAHMITHFPGPPFQCENCSYISDVIQPLLSHRLSHSDERPLKCTLCEYHSRSKNIMITHVRNHTGDKPFHCTECGRSFAIKSTLDQHVAAHSEFRPYQCSNCDFSTKYQSHLISHRRIHSGDVFHCHYEDCTYSSPKKSQLAAHLRTHLAVRAHQCKVCNRSFIEKSHLVRHERIHLEDKPFKCDNCDYASSRRDKLKEHIQKHHSQAAVGKQHRRRYRRAKQLAQLAAQNKGQPQIGAIFRPLVPPELIKTPSHAINALVPVESNMTSQESTFFNISGMDGNEQQETSCGSVVHNQNVIEFTSMGNLTGRPSSAMLPHSSTIDLSPTMSLNFQLAGTDTPLLSGSKDVTLAGTISDSPFDSLRTPVPRSPHSVTLHSLGDPFIGSPINSQDLQRPMSLPPYGGQQQGLGNQPGSPWDW